MNTLDQIAASLQGYDPQSLSTEDVNRFLTRMVQPITQTETLPLFQALGRVLAQEVISPISVPPHDNSAMDGYAFDGAALGSAETESLTLKMVGTALAGKAWVGQADAGECVKIMTGAIMPKGLDTVVPQEFVQVHGDTIRFPIKALGRGDNRRKLGEDLRQGEPALRQGQILAPAALGLLASLGLPQVTVYKKLRVAYFSTGDEILSLGDAPREGAVFDSNRYTVFGLLTRLGCEVADLGVVRDEPALLEAAFVHAADMADAIITSGGVSVGEADHTKAMMQKLGDVAFWRIAMRPGRPMAVGLMNRAPTPAATHLPVQGRAKSLRAARRLFGEKLASDPCKKEVDSYQNSSNESAGHAVLFGLPGNPVAVMVTFLAFVRPALLRMMGSSASTPPLLKAHSQEPLRKKPGRTEYQRGFVFRAPDGSLHVKTTGNQGSGVLSSMVHANGLIVLSHAQGNVAVGELVEVMMFEGSI